MSVSRFRSTLLLLIIAIATAAAHADMLNFSAVGVSASFNGSGTTTPKRAGQFLITGLTGLIAPDGFRGNNNLLFPSNMPTVDSHGFSFTDLNGPDRFNVNIFDDASGYFAYLQDEDNLTQVVPVFAVPESSTFLLLATGLLSAAALRRKDF